MLELLYSESHSSWEWKAATIRPESEAWGSNNSLLQVSPLFSIKNTFSVKATPKILRAENSNGQHADHHSGRRLVLLQTPIQGRCELTERSSKGWVWRRVVEVATTIDKLEKQFLEVGENGGKYFVTVMFVQSWIHGLRFCQIFRIFRKMVWNIAECCGERRRTGNRTNAVV